MYQLAKIYNAAFKKFTEKNMNPEANLTIVEPEPPVQKIYGVPVAREEIPQGERTLIQELESSKYREKLAVCTVLYIFNGSTLIVT